MTQHAKGKGEQMKVLLINDSSSSSNWGDRAAAIALKAMIADCGGTLCGVVTEDDMRDGRYLNPPVGNDWPQKTGTRSLRDWVKLFVPPVALKLRENMLQYLSAPDPIPLTVEGFEAAADEVLADRARFGGLLDAIGQADVTVIHGDGAMVGNGLIPRTELFFSYLIKTRFHKPVILINHTTDFNHPDLDRMASSVYPLLDDVTYRDQTSEDLCRDRWPGRYAADTPFSSSRQSGKPGLRWRRGQPILTSGRTRLPSIRLSPTSVSVDRRSTPSMDPCMIIQPALQHWRTTCGRSIRGRSCSPPLILRTSCCYGRWRANLVCRWWA